MRRRVGVYEGGVRMERRRDVCVYMYLFVAR